MEGNLLISFLVILTASISSVLGMQCDPSSRFPWIQESLQLGAPWINYTNPNNQCCNSVNPNINIDFNAQCSMCYNSTVNLAFILDPNDCQKYYICVPRSQGGYDAYNMACADCQFWDNDKLTCVEVDQSCRTNPSVPTGTPLPRFTHDPKLTCIDFENSSLTTGGLYVKNGGVQIVTNGEDGVADDFCPGPGNSCGLFNKAFMELPFFINNYADLPNIRISMDVLSQAASSSYESLFSNDCFNGIPSDFHNSLYLGVWGGGLMGKVEDKYDEQFIVHNEYQRNTWFHVEMFMTGEELFLVVDGNLRMTPLSESFTGIKQSKCPLTFGKLVKDDGTHMFDGYMDNICIHIDYSL